jgi:large subunit ribosomal protein L6
MLPGLRISVEDNILTVSRENDDQQNRALRKPEPYKGKGIKYSDERIIRKAGKSGKEK